MSQRLRQVNRRLQPDGLAVVPIGSSGAYEMIDQMFGGGTLSLYSSLGQVEREMADMR